MATQDALFIVKETTAGTFVTPTVALSGVQSFSLDRGLEKHTRYESGRSGGIVDITNGVQNPSGSLTVGVEPDNIGTLLLALANTVTKSTPSGATNSRDHAFLVTEANAFKTLSAQYQRKATGTVATNIRGMAINSASLSIQAEAQMAELSVDWIAREETEAGTDFGNGNTSPAAQTISYNALEAFLNPNNVTVTLGGTPSLDGTTKIYTTSGGSAISCVEAITINWEFNRSNLIGLAAYPCDQETGTTTFTVELTLRDNTPSYTYWAKMINATEEALLIKIAGSVIESGFNNELEIAFPLLHWTAVTRPNLESERGPRTITATGTAVLDSNANHFGIRYRNDNDTGY